MAVPRAARRSVEIKDQASAARPTLQRMRPRAPPKTALYFVFAFSVAVPRTARRIRKKKESARGEPGNSCGRGRLLSRQPRTLWLTCYGRAAFRTSTFPHNSSSERGAPCNARASPLKAAIGASVRTAVPRAARRAGGRMRTLSQGSRWNSLWGHEPCEECAKLAGGAEATLHQGPSVELPMGPRAVRGVCQIRRADACGLPPRGPRRSSIRGHELCEGGALMVGGDRLGTGSLR